MAEPRRRSTALRARSKVWIERDGQIVMSEYRARLLEAVDREGSVAAAADALGLPNRTAWKKLREIEEAAGTPLLESGSGGPAGGQSKLTPAAKEMLVAFRRIADPVDEGVQERFIEEQEHFRR
ncbi:MAG: LysR family transcriptional regulator [Chloroflexi bacterium]|nr:LysR family transcriptional regulator [Chloroflexota bacterium]